MAEKEYIDREILLKMNFYTENCNSFILRIVIQRKIDGMIMLSKIL